LALKLDFNEKLSFEEIIRQLLIQEKVFKSGNINEGYSTESQRRNLSKYKGEHKRLKKQDVKDDFV
jgi:hypothetical protein